MWTDQKAKAKQKLRDNKIEVMATGGGPNKMHSFSANEEAIINLLSLDKAVDHDGKFKLRIRFSMKIPH